MQSGKTHSTQQQHKSRLLERTPAASVAERQSALSVRGSANIYVVCLFLSHRTEACSALMLHSDKSVHV